MSSAASGFRGVLLFLLVFTLPVPAAPWANAAPEPAAASGADSDPGGPGGTTGGPGPEREVLERTVGVWDATVTIPGGPDSPPRTSKGVETITLGRGGLWTITDFTGTMDGEPFQGHGITGYDPARRKYVGVWVDSTAPSLWLSEGEYDAATRTLTTWTEGRDDEGNPVRWKQVTVSRDRDTRIFTMYAPGPGGEQQPGLTITYRRRR